MAMRRRLFIYCRGAFGGPSPAGLTACMAPPPRVSPSVPIHPHPTRGPSPDICLCRVRQTKRSPCWCWAQRLSNACRRPPLAGLWGLRQTVAIDSVSVAHKNDVRVWKLMPRSSHIPFCNPSLQSATWAAPAYSAHSTPTSCSTRSRTAQHSQKSWFPDMVVHAFSRAATGWAEATAAAAARTACMSRPRGTSSCKMTTTDFGSGT